jgi:hypothetical protein
MRAHRDKAWFRALAAVLTLCSSTLLVLHPPLAAFAQDSPQAFFDTGVAAYRLVELERAEQNLRRAAELLRPKEQTDPEARRLAAQVYLYRGRVAMVADRPEEARAHFRAALERDPTLVMVTETDPPRIVKAFEQARKAMQPAQAAPAPAEPAPQPAQTAPAQVAVVPKSAPSAKRGKKKWIWWALGGAAVAAAAAVAIGASGGGDGNGNGGGLDISGLWNTAMSQLDGCNEDFEPHMFHDLDIHQNGQQITIEIQESLVSGTLSGTLQGISLSFSGTTTKTFDGCFTTERYTGSGTASLRQINGQLTFIRTQRAAAARDSARTAAPPCVAECTYRYSYNLTRP